MDPQVTLGLLTDATGFPLTVAAFEGNTVETDTMLPVINAFKAAHGLTDGRWWPMPDDLQANQKRSRPRTVLHPGHRIPRVPGDHRMARHPPRPGYPTDTCSPSPAGDYREAHGIRIG